MKIITWKDQFDENQKAEIGGKAYNLWKYQELNIPNWICLPTSFFQNLYANEYLKIIELLSAEQFEEEKIAKLILAKQIDQTDLALIKDTIKRILPSSNKLAIRSSGVDEDSENYSFAGEMESFLNIDLDEIEEYIKKCFLSAFSKKAIFYRKMHNLTLKDIKMAVIIQEMIEADYAGVMNTINPITNNPDEFVISLVEGLGEKLVSGAENSIDYFVNGDNIVVSTNNSPISLKLIKAIAKLGYEVLRKAKHFQDIEFCLKGKTIYLLQTRDITPYVRIDLTKERKVLDNSNIVESYAGVTLPLTFSFAREIYYKLYKQTLEAAKIPTKIIKTLEPSLKEMIVSDENRIYYNLNSWYHLNSIFPNSHKSLGYMERMMGVKTKMTNTKKIKLGLGTILRSGIIFIKKIKNMENLTKKFLHTFDEIVTPYLGSDFKQYNGLEVLEIYQLIEDKILGDYTTTIINDSACMIYYGMLTKKVQKSKIADPEGFISKKVSKQGDVASAMSAPCFLKIIELINADSKMKEDFETLTLEALTKKYHQSSIKENSEFSKRVDEYLSLYGARVLDELKLETITLYEDPSLLYEMLQNQILNQKILKPKNEPVSQKDDNFKCNKTLNYLIKKTKYFIKNRELLRLKRTYIFSVVRRIFLRLGQLLAEQQIIAIPRDVFYLQKDEVFGLIRKNPNIKIEKITTLVATRKQNIEKSRQLPNYERIIFYGNEKLVVESSNNNTSSLQGIPSGAGIVKGYVNYVQELKNANVNNEIIMAYRTDPGWIILFPLCKGLIVERGSILSHSAVVAREMGIPAVVGIPNVTKIIKNHDLVIVDGIKGEVVVCEE